MKHPSVEYHVALEKTKKFHLKNKGFSGRFLFRYADDVRDLIQATASRTMLDYGCGRGKQYALPMADGRLLPDYLGVSVTKYDPGWQPFAADPVGKFDIVVVTQVLGSIPTQDLGWVLDRIFRYARRAVYIAEVLCLAPRKKLHKGMNMPYGWGHEDWAVIIGQTAFNFPDIVCQLRTKDKRTAKGPRRLETFNLKAAT